MASNFLTRLLKRTGSSQRPHIDTHALYTSSQMSSVIVQGQLSVHEPWRKNKKKPKCVYACLYTNDSSPFIAWYTDKNRKKPRGFFNLRGGKIAPVGEYSFQIAFNGTNNNNVYKFNTECWEKREEWLCSLREESRKEVPQMPALNAVSEVIRQSKDDLAVANKTHGNRPAWKSHRRTLSAGSPLPNLARCQVQLQRSRSQPHIQKGKLVKKRPMLLEKQRTVGMVGQTIKRDKQWFIRSPEVCRS